MILSEAMLYEAMSFDRLLRVSEPKRLVRSRTVKGPPLPIDTYADSEYWSFNFKANPSTEGRRHHGYIKFIKPPSPRPLEQLDCMVDCTCKDYRYRWAWANKQRGSGRVGPGTMNQAWNRAPRKTNPTGKPGLCKHILALRDFIYGRVSSFPATDREGDSSRMMNTLVKYANKKWLENPETEQERRQRERVAANTRLARNRGSQLPTNAPSATELVDDPAVSDELPAPPSGTPPTNTLSQDMDAPVGRPGPAARAWMGPNAPEEPESEAEPEAEPGQPIPVVTGRRRTPRPPSNESVVIHNMNLIEAKQVVEELVGDLSVNAMGAGAELDSAAGEEGDPQGQALNLLGEIRDLLAQLVSGGGEKDEDETPPPAPVPDEDGGGDDLPPDSDDEDQLPA